jgi:hypothetical protein
MAMPGWERTQQPRDTDRHGERNHDKGGNSRLVFFLDQQRAVNLHKVWDSSVIRFERGNPA